jgi:hypothetical protein
MLVPQQQLVASMYMCNILLCVLTSTHSTRVINRTETQQKHSCAGLLQTHQHIRLLALRPARVARPLLLQQSALCSAVTVTAALLQLLLQQLLVKVPPNQHKPSQRCATVLRSTCVDASSSSSRSSSSCACREVLLQLLPLHPWHNIIQIIHCLKHVRLAAARNVQEAFHAQQLCTL